MSIINGHKILFIYWLQSKLNIDFSSLANLTFSVDISPHLFDDLFADTHTQTSSLGVHILMLLELCIVLKKLVDIFDRDTRSIVFDYYPEFYVFLYVNWISGQIFHFLLSLLWIASFKSLNLLNLDVLRDLVENIWV